MENNEDNPGFSREREFKVILEDIHKQFRTFGEGLEDVQNRLGRVETDITQIKVDVTDLKLNVTFIRKVLPTLATKDDLRPFDRRLSALEKLRSE